MSTVIQDDYVRDGRHKNLIRRKQTTTSYIHHGHEMQKHLHFCMALVRQIEKMSGIATFQSK